MRHFVLAGTAAAALAMLSAPTLAQEASPTAPLPDWSEGWSGQATLYLWIPAFNGAQEGPDGQPLVDLDQVDVLSRLDMAFMGAAEIRKGRWGLLFDAVYADLSNDGEWLQQRIETETNIKLGVYMLAAAYRVYENDETFGEIYGGARFFDARLDFGIATQNNGADADANLDWADPIVGLRGATPLTERWSVSGRADVGGFERQLGPQLAGLRRRQLRLRRALGRHDRLPLHVDPLRHHRPREARHDDPGTGLRHHLRVLTRWRARTFA